MAQPARPFELDTISEQWQRALDAAERALTSLSGLELERRRPALVEERKATARLLEQVARATGVRPVPWLAPMPVTANMLALPTGVKACLFDLDGVLTNSAVLHASAWGEVFDEFLLRLGEKTGWHFIPFDRDADYFAYLDGRPRLEGVHAFLNSRGIRLPEGRLEDSARADTACGLAKRKGEALARGVRTRGVTALAGARRYLEAAGHAGLARVVVSASVNAMPMLDMAGLATLVEERIDADVVRAEGLRSRPAPDALFFACRRLGIPPEEAVTFTHSAAGVAAGRAAGLLVIGVGDEEQGEVLRGFGADHVICALNVQLDPRLTFGACG